ncbi:hypothetical protein TWF106_008808 [Orbilia oligospora]|uniref:Uncharacterized protein n=1 Tax=Orbilia oligospora TaxID=2813651 RepID=A0A6G1M6B9_ORBOL|nr:hypothetical protein TWF679_006616 [Orbilia oligospora]KAF3215301.1 hypothetical protein TWF106_008808 [Orbilia oligospora]KAF3227844.1 hypothetical protein TWF191_003366 [Orbilia oligospora]KAF3244706.1 hypothetical protein TWF192_007640 [Orbilia oligospora]
MQRYPLATYNNPGGRRTPRPYAQIGSGSGSGGITWTITGGSGAFPTKPLRAILPPLPASSSTLNLNDRIYSLNSSAINSTTSIWSTAAPSMPPPGPVYRTPIAPANTPIRTPPAITPPMAYRSSHSSLSLPNQTPNISSSTISGSSSNLFGIPLSRTTATSQFSTALQTPKQSFTNRYSGHQFSGVTWHRDSIGAHYTTDTGRNGRVFWNCVNPSQEVKPPGVMCNCPCSERDCCCQDLTVICEPDRDCNGCLNILCCGCWFNNNSVNPAAKVKQLYAFCEPSTGVFPVTGYPHDHRLYTPRTSFLNYVSPYRPFR